MEKILNIKDVTNDNIADGKLVFIKNTGHCNICKAINKKIDIYSNGYFVFKKLSSLPVERGNTFEYLIYLVDVLLEEHPNKLNIDFETNYKDVVRIVCHNKYNYECLIRLAEYVYNLGETDIKLSFNTDNYTIDIKLNL